MVLLISSVYLVAGMVAKLSVSEMLYSIQSRETVARQVEVMATPVSFLLWRIIIRENEQYKMAYFSLLDTEKELKYQHIKMHPDRDSLDNLLKEKKYFDQLQRFSKNLYRYVEDSGKIYFSDVRLAIEGVSPFRFQVAYRNSAGELNALPTAKRTKVYGAIRTPEILAQLISKL